MPRALLAAVLVLAVAAGCGARASAGGFTAGRLNVVTAFYPLQFLSERIGGGTVRVLNLTKPGAEPHDVELNPRQVADVADAGLAVYLSGFQPAVDTAVEQEAKGHSFDVASAVDLLPYTQDSEEDGDKDPHVWLDPVRFATIAGQLGDRLAAADPANAASYRSRARQLQDQLRDLDRTYARSLATCRRHELVTSHSAFNYLATRYGLTQVGITGISPEAEPAPRRLAEVARTARATGTTTIFFETLVSPKVAETIAREVGARTAVLDPLEGLTDPAADYFSVMRANLAALTTALGCTA
ncbi:zinc ABC transporter substrate-binding protein [Paractinoplanes ferrugineus]|uniref:Zinc ABC transporter substrate-binding protein n=1 Tax=Paractinoplanes ferrugineus TaxID=113564 RepID=A0A919J7G4_9ACTN|nr:metal ABC transporter substrate-binding protein [Actinoplanes ferrugineus]GIE14697.1 zinc ABC transporter substrate-binding protein [Actinoplanes ferrugineus]